MRRPEAEPDGNSRKQAEDGLRLERTLRPMRVTRATRLSAMHRLALAAEDVRRRIIERLGIERTEVESVKPAETVKPAEKIAPTVTETPGQKLRRRIEHQRQQQQRRSQGMGI